MNNKMPNVECVVCGKNFYAKPSRLERVKHGLSCSVKCKNEFFKGFYSGKNNPNYKSSSLKPLEIFFRDKHNKLQHTAKQRGISYDLTPKILEEIYKKQNGNCYYSNIPMKLFTESWNKKNQADIDVLSVDRIDNSIGYFENNIVMCCVGINKMKGTSSEEDMQRIFNYIVAKSTQNPVIKIKKLHQDARLPQKMNFGDVGYDIWATEVVEKENKNYIEVKTGISVQPSAGFYCEIFPRSSIYKKGLLLANSVGVIDNQYTGEIKLIFYKITPSATLVPGDRVAQLVAKKFFVPHIIEVDSLTKTSRGDDGFGSTGV